MARVNEVAAVAFVIGGSLFTLGPLLAEFGVGSIRCTDVVYLIEGLFFRPRGLCLRAADVEHAHGDRGERVTELGGGR